MPGIESLLDAIKVRRDHEAGHMRGREERSRLPERAFKHRFRCKTMRNDIPHRGGHLLVLLSAGE